MRHPRQASDDTTLSHRSTALGIHREFWVMRSDVPQLSGSLTGCSDWADKLTAGMGHDGGTHWGKRTPHHEGRQSQRANGLSASVFKLWLKDYLATAALDVQIDAGVLINASAHPPRSTRGPMGRVAITPRSDIRGINFTVVLSKQ
ncbi:hypothetical protein NQZ68_014130 [Dissostichus eleginoides]|nr:hypothetical protein NQZ68_014130 [Dissostichus eleginoides]